MVLQDGPIVNTPFFITPVNITNGITIARGRLDGSFYYANAGGGETGGNGATIALACNPKPDTVASLQSFQGGTITDTLLPNQCLFYGHGLTSANGCFSLIFQSDGNLVITKKGNSTILYETATANKAAFQVCFNKSPGKVVVYAIGNFVFDTKTSGGTSLKLENDGNLILYSGATKIWSSNSAQNDTTC